MQLQTRQASRDQFSDVLPAGSAVCVPSGADARGSSVLGPVSAVGVTGQATVTGAAPVRCSSYAPPACPAASIAVEIEVGHYPALLVPPAAAEALGTNRGEAEFADVPGQRLGPRPAYLDTAATLISEAYGGPGVLTECYSNLTPLESPTA